MAYRGVIVILSLFERSQWEETEAFYRMSKFNCVQKIFHFEFRKFGRISYRKIQKIWNLRYFTQNVSGVTSDVRFWWNLHQSVLTYRQTMCSVKVLIFWKLTDLCYFYTKNHRKQQLLLFFTSKILHKLVSFQNIKNLALQIVLLYVRTLWCKFQKNRTTIATLIRFA